MTLSQRCIIGLLLVASFGGFRESSAIAAGGAAAAVAQTDAGVPASAAPSSQPATVGAPTTVREAIAQLSSPHWSQRDAAGTYLLRQSPEVRSEVEAAFWKTTDPEARLRLRQIALHLYLKSQTPLEGHAAVLGIALALEVTRIGPPGTEPRMTVAVMELQPGFPSAEVLRAGDRLIAMNGSEFPSDMTIADFRRQVNAMQPGQVLRVTVLRGRQQLDVSVTLAGVPEAGDSALRDYVEERTVKATNYLRHLTEPEEEAPGARYAPDPPLVIGGP